MTIALARRYRPKRFADLLVQDHVAAVLRGAVARGRVGHGYLLTGPRGVGKTTAARILAMALNCPNRDADAAIPAASARTASASGTARPTSTWSRSTPPATAGVDDARDLRERAMYAASQEGHYKVYIVDEAHMLTREAWNALLKILEEPPPGVVFVFATTEPQKIAATAAPVLSRLQRFDFRRIGPAAIRDRLRQVLDAEGIAADDDALTLIARHADGGMRDALSVLDQCLSFGEGAVTADRVREVLGLVGDELYAEALGWWRSGARRASSRWWTGWWTPGADLAEFMGGAGEVLRALLMLQLGAAPEGLTEAVRQALERYRDRLEPGDVLRMLRLLADSETAIRRSANPRLVVETLLLRWAMMDRTVDLRGGAAAGAEPGRPAPGAGGAQGPSPDCPGGRRADVPGDSHPARRGAGAAPRHRRRPPPAGTHEPVRHRHRALAEAWPDIVADVREPEPLPGRGAGRHHAGTGRGLRHCRWCSPSRTRCSPSAFRRRRPRSKRSCGGTPARRCRIRVTVGEGREARPAPPPRS